MSRSRLAPVRVLLGCTGWPCGLLEIGSWAHHQGLAEVVIVQIQPGRLCRLDAADCATLRPGRAGAELRDALARHGQTLPAEATVVRGAGQSWELRDPRGRRLSRLVPAGSGFEVLAPSRIEPVGDDGHPGLAQLDAPACRSALLDVGRGFLQRLLLFRPHLVGFRLEAGGLDELRRFIAAVRLVCDAQIVVGGPTPTSHPGEVFEACDADYVFAGEAEETFAQFLRLARMPNSRDRVAEIPGLVYRYGNRIYHNSLPRDGYGRSILEAGTRLATCEPPRARTEGMAARDEANRAPATAPARLDRRCLRNLDRPIASAAVLSANRLHWSLLEGFAREFDSLFFTGGRGCPGACTFCAKLHGQEVRVKDAAQLLAEIAAADGCVRAGRLHVSRWPLFAHVEGAMPRDRQVAWAAVYDEDFFLHRRRAVEFLRLWSESPLQERYRLSFQTNPCTLLGANGAVDGELFHWIDRLKPMIQLGGESFHPDVLARWRKRHQVEQLQTVCDALEGTRQDYTVFQLLTDFETSATELVESLRLLILNAYERPRMRIASSPYTIPLYDSETRARLEASGRLTPDRASHFTDYERPRPDWMDPLVAELADLADAELQWTLQPTERDAALGEAMRVVTDRIAQEAAAGGASAALVNQARRALDDVREAGWGLGVRGKKSPLSRKRERGRG